MRTILFTTLYVVLVVGSFGLAGCGDSEEERSRLLREAREGGFAMGIAERCGLEHQWSRGMPSRYDDSTGDGKIASAWQSGYSRARALDQPCIYGMEGRPPRTY
jgi:hypothetical protein